MKRLSYLSLLPLGLATQVTETIPYQLQPAAETLLKRHVDTSFTTELLKHGCWCAKLDSTSDLKVLGGNKVVDELDQLCKNWAKTRRCGKNPSENCENFGKNDNYQLSSGDTGYSTGTLLCPDSDACLKETCEVDVWFLNEIEGFRLENSGFVADESHACNLPFAGRPGLWPAKQLGYNNCPFLKDSVDYDSLISCAAGYQLNPGPSCGLMTTTPAGTDDVNNALSAVGVDNSDKQLSITLVWYETYQLDLHILQPDGQEISWKNMGPLASTGRQDADALEVGANGLAVENISWLTAPSGLYRVFVINYYGNDPGTDYKLYVQNDGVFDVYERSAPAGDNTMYEVLSFNYENNNGRSFKADVDVSESLSAAFPDQGPVERRI